MKLSLVILTLLLSSAAFADCDRSHARWNDQDDKRTPVTVPEPSSMALAGTGLLTLLGLMIRKAS